MAAVKKTANTMQKTKAKTNMDIGVIRQKGKKSADQYKDQNADMKKESPANNRAESLVTPELKGSRTEQCLMEAYISEAKVWTKYSIFAEKAKKDGYEKISDIFKTVSENELAHAAIWFKLLHDNEYQPTETNLDDSVKGEHTEHAELYAEFEKIARAEGFDGIAEKFRQIGEIEKSHEEQFKTELSNVKNQRVFRRKQKQTWVCRNCGNLHMGTEAPQECNVCGYPKAFFEIKPV